MNHTPGPWEAIQEDQSCWKVVSEDYGTVVKVQAASNVQAQHIPLEANARLIASAPMLLESLKALRHETCVEHAGLKKTPVEIAADAVIATAEYVEEKAAASS